MVAGLVLAGAAWGGTTGWRLYEATLLPQARSVPTHTPTPVVDPVVLREEGRRQRAVTDHIAAGNALLLGNQRAGAAEEYRRALTLDPSNMDARAGLQELGFQPPPGVAATPTVARPTPLPTVTPRLQR
ncbi:MAG: hypothetical protein AVDCRST_MAG77-1412 [uncultured Chloroflexi bacterium]|uniref:Tetratricopeptide repeat protein n=1 Tax=uncultured Chloroflexota bacterium TaxID=166587 RepID=A0A6J4I1G1_9CHLR|nr:MAG: hypothetical protein AVDCRST_MAG77-1412 [uncultured Chloroflexota bacterium]